MEVTCPRDRANANTTMLAAAAPTNALPVRVLAPRLAPIPNRIDAAAPVDAPDVIPRM